MGLGDYFSSKGEVEQANTIRKKYLWECEKNPQEQKTILKDVFIKKGFTEEDSKKIVEHFGENTQTFADILLLEKEGICFENNAISPLKSGIMTFISFQIFGLIPLISFIFTPDKSIKLTLDLFFLISLILTCFSLFLLGAIKNWIVSKVRNFNS
jgi:vacuolar iron transporter family protein